MKLKDELRMQILEMEVFGDTNATVAPDTRVQPIEGELLLSELTA